MLSRSCPCAATTTFTPLARLAPSLHTTVASSSSIASNGSFASPATGHSTLHTTVASSSSIASNASFTSPITTPTAYNATPTADAVLADPKPVHADVHGLELLPDTCTRCGVRTHAAELFGMCYFCALRRPAQLL